MNPATPQSPIESGENRPMNSIKRANSIAGRIIVTIFGLVIWTLGPQISLPAIDRPGIAAQLAANQGGGLSQLDKIAETTLSSAHIFTLGINPYLSAAILALLISGLLPALRRLRDTEGEQNRRFGMVILCATVCIALIHSYGFSASASALQSACGMEPVSGGGKALIAATVVAGTALLVWIAHFITRFGAGNGIVVLVWAGLLKSFFEGLQRQSELVASGLQSSEHSMLSLAAAIGIICACVVALRRRREVGLALSQQNGAARDEHPPLPRVSIAHNSVGIIPLMMAQSFLYFLSMAGIQLGTMAYWSLSTIATIVLVYVWTAATFSAKDMWRILQKHGYRLVDSPTDSDGPAVLDRTIERAVLPYAIFLAALGAVPFALSSMLGVDAQLAATLGPSMLALVSTSMALWDGLNARRNMAMHNFQNGEAESSEAQTQCVYSAETELDNNLAVHLLKRSGIPARRISTRAISITGTFAFWEQSRPAFPAFTIYRGLGGGSVGVLVSPERETEALEVLRARELISG